MPLHNEDRQLSPISRAAPCTTGATGSSPAASTGAPADQPDFILVICRTDPVIDPKARHKGLSAFMLEKPRGELPDGVKGSFVFF